MTAYLSTCVVGLVKWCFTKFQGWVKAISRNRELVHRLDTEITDRLSESLFMLEGYSQRLKLEAAWFSRRELFLEVMRKLDGQSFMYEEFAKRRLLSLLVELKRLLPSRDREQIQVAVDAFSHLRQEAERAAGSNVAGRSGGPGAARLPPEESEAAKKDLHDVNDILRNKLRLKRWQYLGTA
jgi:hypothetical protein